MATRMTDVFGLRADELRHEPLERRLRATLGGEVVVDSVAPQLVWEPRRIVPSYAVPARDIRAHVRPAVPPLSEAELTQLPPILHPGIPFAVHTAAGTVLTVVHGREVREMAAFRPADAALADHVVLDFFAFDGWLEEDETILGHPRDPFHRIDVVRSSRTVRIERGGLVIAESSRPRMLFETSLPVRWYLPREDFRVPLVPSAKRTTCAYKGHASYWSFGEHGELGTDLAWSYGDPQPDAIPVRDLVACFDEHVDVFVDGECRPRPATQWS
ncbi:MAG: short-chain dehydrogenase of uncharacterized substrate specificity [Solirubrobacterales bacterium]|nr:short-chain dehydrogenase of uncharacterized substrate specificity [Solirubrobacterales bacterium]